MTHELKTFDEYMVDIASGKKTFEVRKNDRVFNEGDSLVLFGINSTTKEITGKIIHANITYILHGGQYGLEDGYCVMAIKVTDYNF